MEMIRERMSGGDIEHVFIAQNKWEEIVMDKFLEYDPNREAYTDCGSMTLYITFEEAFNLVSKCIVAELEEITPQLVNAIKNPQEVQDNES